jgi:hypothetical protein
MNPNHPRQYLAANHRAVAYENGHAAAHEWEAPPSLMRFVVQRGARRAAADASPPMAADSAWNTTMAASLDPLPQSQPFREPWQGVVIREVFEPGVFQHFFGPQAAGE